MSESGFKPIVTSRLILRPPVADDAARIFQRYSADPEVTRFVGWPRHADISATQSFVQFSDSEWARWPAGPLLIESREGTLLGSTGLAFDSRDAASTGYVLARDAWGFGYASEALAAIVSLSADFGLTRLYALCHPSHAASIRVLKRCGFRGDGMLATPMVFPNLGVDTPQSVACYALAGTASTQSGQDQRSSPK